MAAIITNYYRLFNAKQFIESVKEPFAGGDANANAIHYVFIGRPQSWSNDNLPPTPVDTVNLQFEVYKDMVALKKVTASEVSHVIPREDWVSGTVYDEYDHAMSSTNPAYSGATSLFLSNFYVLTDEYKVYKCLFNNGNGASTVKPTSTSTTPVTLADGYIWKYMYTIDTDSVLNFLTPEFMPVKACTTVQAAAVDGAIEIIKIVSGGSGYVSTPTVSIVGDGNAAVSAVATRVGGNIANITVQTAANGWHVANVTLVGGAPNANATARAILSPPGGHGSNPVDELGGYYVMMTSRLQYNEGAGDYPTTNDFRRIGILVDPLVYTNGNVRANANTLSATWSITTTNTTAAFAIDEVIRGNVSGANARILTTTDPVIGGNSITRYIQPIDDTSSNQIRFQVGDYVTGVTSGTVGIVSQVSSPEVKQHSGSVIYVDNRKPISRAADQAESIHIVVEF
jgi:hypothetical protein